MMTEQEWNDCLETDRMFHQIRFSISDRKGRLFAVACVRHALDSLFFSVPSRRLLILKNMELLAEGKLTEEEHKIERAQASVQSQDAWTNYLTLAVFYTTDPCGWVAGRDSSMCCLNAVGGRYEPGVTHDCFTKEGKAEKKWQTDLLRHIVPYSYVPLNRAIVNGDVQGCLYGRAVYKS